MSQVGILSLRKGESSKESTVEDGLEEWTGGVGKS